jgi:hypothetical protein
MVPGGRTVDFSAMNTEMVNIHIIQVDEIKRFVTIVVEVGDFTSDPMTAVISILPNVPVPASIERFRESAAPAIEHAFQFITRDEDRNQFLKYFLDFGIREVSFAKTGFLPS